MLTTVLTLTLFVAYWRLRKTYARLPLHIDTGFYVSNHTVATGRLDFSRGWNATYAGCSKLLPEFFYSKAYLQHRAAKRGQSDSSYKVLARHKATWTHLITAIAVGLLASQLGGDDAGAYWAGLLLFALLSSEPHWGVYFECAELFELPFQVWGVICLLRGWPFAAAGWIAAGAFLWTFEALFVKLSSLVACAVLLGGAIILKPAITPAVLAGCAAAGTLYVLAVWRNGRSLRQLFRPLVGHESSFGQRADLRAVVHRLREKFVRLVRTTLRQPLIVGLALTALVLAPPREPVIVLYFAAVLVTYLIQAADCWYYQVPLLPALALLATPVVVTLIEAGPLGWLALTVAAMFWIDRNWVRPARLTMRGLAEWCCGGAIDGQTLEGDLRLDECALQLATAVNGRSLLVYGPFTQAYVLAGASYDTPLITPDRHLDDMHPGWQRELSLQVRQAPPDFILDTDECFDAAAMRDGLGLDYRLQQVFVGRFRLYQLAGVRPTDSDRVDVLTYAAQSVVALRNEEALGSVRPPVSDAAPCPDAHADRLATLLRDLAGQGYCRLGIYGAGRFTTRYAELYRRSPVPVAAVLDDDPARHGSTLMEWPVYPLHQAEALGIDAVVLSSDRFDALLAAKARRAFAGRVPVVSALGEPPAGS